MEHEGPPSHATCTQVPCGTSLVGSEMMHVSTVLGSPSSQSAAVMHWLGAASPQPASIPVPLDAMLREIPELDEPPVRPAPPLPPLLAVVEAPAPLLLALPVTAPLDALHAAAATTITVGEASRHRVSTPAITRLTLESSP
jgi:hypothetical protein